MEPRVEYAFVGILFNPARAMNFPLLPHLPYGRDGCCFLCVNQKRAILFIIF